jgi:uncharacterized protein DUF4242
MENVVAERLLDEPMMADRLRTMHQQMRRCLEENRVSYVRTYLSADGRRMTCLFAAPDAESVRRVNQVSGIPALRVWTASLHGPAASGDDGAETAVIVERSFAAATSLEELAVREEAGSWCLDMHRVRYLRTYFSVDRRRMLCLYTAPDAESVRRRQKHIGLPFDAVWTATVERH